MSFAQDVLDTLAPMLYLEQADALTDYVTGVALPFEDIEDWVSDTDTEIGWSLFLDPERCPDEALPWLAQIVGLTLPGNLTPAQQRQQIEDANNWRRGTKLAMAGAAAPYLTGLKTVVVRERYDGSGNDAPYYIQVITYSTETPDAVAVEAAIRTQKPAGIILTYTDLTGQDYQTVKDNYASYQLVKDHYPTYAGVKANQVV